MSYLELDEYKNRLAKLHELRALGLDPYPHRYEPTHRCQELHDTLGKTAGHYDDAIAGKGDSVCVAGRLMLFRSMGKNAFAKLQDASGAIQLMCNKEATSLTGFFPSAELSAFKCIEKKLDLGDIVGVKGLLFCTQKGELTILVTELTLLSKSLLPLPEKHSGLKSVETRLRKRHLDLIDNRDVFDTFRTRSRIIACIRQELYAQNFMEVETPVLQSLYGGANARPFETHFHSLDQHMYLRIALELPLKKLITGGFERVFELAKVFRNEGLDRNHNPEFTMLEAYAAWWDYNDQMVFCENLYAKIAQTLFGSCIIPFQEHHIDLSPPWKRMTMCDAIAHYGHFDVSQASDKALQERLRSCGVEDVGLPRGLLIAGLFEALVEDKLIAPHHIIDHPIETTPLCKLHRDKKLAQAGFVERFESFIVGQEICNAYTELNDPVLQRTLFEAQAAKKSAGDSEAHPLDEDFLEAICQGMPPTGGIGIGIDRLVMLFCNVPSIRDVLFFPFMKAEH